MQPLVRGTIGASGTLVIFAVGTVVLTNLATSAAKAIINHRQVFFCSLTIPGEKSMQLDIRNHP